MITIDLWSTRTAALFTTSFGMNSFFKIQGFFEEFLLVLSQIKAFCGDLCKGSLGDYVKCNTIWNMHWFCTYSPPTMLYRIISKYSRRLFCNRQINVLPQILQLFISKIALIKYSFAKRTFWESVCVALTKL